ncbi:hypothetical protein TFLX_01132 [Thermoflexales bacterium]|nr:hypothetical protein TFLX_01132 [Thermoflexales bacterium]
MPDLHWHVGEGAERQTIAKATANRRSRRSWIAILLVIVLGVGVGTLYRSIPEPAPRPTPTPHPTPRPTPTYPPVPAKLYAAIDQEAQALADGDAETYLALLAPENDSGGQQQHSSFYAWGRPTGDRPLYEIIDSNLRTSTKAWADIRQFRNGRWFRETRFYVWEKDRWLRSQYPDIFFWSGQTETFDTLHFHAVYALEDRELVHSLVNQLEGVYPQVCRDLGCAEAAAEFTYTLKFNGTSSDALWLSADTHELHFSSPRVTGVFEDSLLDSSGAFWFITIAAVQRAYYDAATQWNGDADGHIVFNAIIGWAMRRHGDKPNALPSIISYLKSQPLVPWKDLWGKGYVFQADSNVIYPEGDLVIYFVEEEYGAQSMPKLLKALGTADSFAALIEKSLGVPFTEFDQKWQAWVKQNLSSQ